MPKSPSTPKSPSKSPAKSPSKSPSTPKKSRTYTVWRSPIDTTPLTAPNGTSIKRTEAVKKYKVKPADLDTITPISRQLNHMDGSAPIQVYNECDVAALALKVRPGKPLPESALLAGPSSSSGGLAKKNGARIMRTTAVKEFKLTPAQMDQLNPVSTTPNVYGGVTKYYNRCEVEALKLRLQTANEGGIFG
ncbi:hypothetical protein B0H17DRAFT_1068431 [Mycena rosella]|uniref:Uncharacterized protein n=1 Tax=Mycena rosella TaxID=1033263 RepID=A0AAD7DCF3_MYCRO|nr:hypothetical protein B0H17DRAFT_1068431 [Mycena rosella]